MRELLESDDQRYVCCVFEVSDLDDPDGRRAFIGYDYLMRKESGPLSADEIQEQHSWVKENFQPDTLARIVLWDRQNCEAAGSAVVGDLDSKDGYAHFIGAYVKEDKRGQGLSKLLHQAQLSLVREHGLIGAYTNIADHNAPSINSALSQGFYLVKSEINETGVSVGSYQMNLPDQRPAPDAELKKNTY